MLSSKSLLTLVVALFSSLILDAQVCPNGNTKITVDKKVVFNAMKKDLAAIQKLWKEA